MYALYKSTFYLLTYLLTKGSRRSPVHAAYFVSNVVAMVMGVNSQTPTTPY